MNYLERVSQSQNAFFVDLFVRASNDVAIGMYKKFGYQIYQTVNKYYSSSLDATGENAHGTHGSMKICGNPLSEMSMAALPDQLAS